MGVYISIYKKIALKESIQPFFMILTSCASILYSSSLVTEILSLSVLSTTTMTNYSEKMERNNGPLMKEYYISARL